VSVAPGTHNLALVIAKAHGLEVSGLDAAARAKLIKSFFRKLPIQTLEKRGRQKATHSSALPRYMARRRARDVSIDIHDMASYRK
jgi:hypothetical protein